MRLTIVLDNPLGVYNPGESVSGRVIADLTEPLTMKALQVMIKGEAQLSWANRHYMRIDTETVFLDRVTLSNDPSMSAGHYEFKFSILLTDEDQLPGTGQFFTGSSHIFGPCKIDYWIEAYIDPPSSKFRTQTKRNIVVRPVLMFQPDPKMTLPRELYDERNICCWCCATGSIKVKISFPKLSFAHDELIAFNVDISNHSGRTIKKVVVYLEQVTRYEITCCPELIFLIMDDTAWTNPIKPGERRQWKNTDLRVPPIENAYPTMVAPMCKMINVTYAVEFVIYVSGCNMNLKLQTPVIIGTMP